MKKFILATAFAALMAAAAQAQTVVNVTGATAFRAATINSIVAGFGGAANVGIVTSVTSGSFTGSNAISFRGNWTGVGDTIIRCRFSGSTEGIRDLVGNGTIANDVFYYNDSEIPAAGSVTYKNENGNPTNANVAQKPDVAFSDIQQTSTPYAATALTTQRVGVITFAFVKSQGSSANLTNVTAQAWKAVLGNSRGVPLNVFTGLSSDQSGRVLATGRNDGSGTRGVYLIETGYGVSRLVNQFKVGAQGSNGVTVAGFTGDANNILQLWPANDAEDANNNSTLWNPAANGNGGYFSGGNVATLLSRDTSSVRVVGPTGVDITSSGSYVGTNPTTPRAVTVLAAVGTSDALTASNGGATVVAYNGTLITPVATGVDPTGLVPADRYKVTNGSYTLWSYERLFNRGALAGTVNTVVNDSTNGIVARIPANLGNAGIALSAMVAVRNNDGDVVTQP